MAEIETTTEAPEPAAVETRSELAKCIEPSAFPADREALLAAVPLDAPEWVQPLLAALPEGVYYENVEEIWEAVGGERF